MKNLALFLILLPVLGVAEPCSDLLNFQMQRLRSSEQIDFCKTYQSKVILAVNTASNCGFTPQFKGLEVLYKKYQDRGLAILGFPSDDFNQAFDNPEDTAKVCFVNYGVTFPIFAKSIVKGANANLFFQKLSNLSGTIPKWNFYKYLINRDSSSIKAFSNFTQPRQLESEIEALLNIE